MRRKINVFCINPYYIFTSYRQWISSWLEWLSIYFVLMVWKKSCFLNCISFLYFFFYSIISEQITTDISELRARIIWNMYFRIFIYIMKFSFPHILFRKFAWFNVLRHRVGKIITLYVVFFIYYLYADGQIPYSKEQGPKGAAERYRSVRTSVTDPWHFPPNFVVDLPEANKKLIFEKKVFLLITF